MAFLGMQYKAGLVRNILTAATLLFVLGSIGSFARKITELLPLLELTANQILAQPFRLPMKKEIARKTYGVSLSFHAVQTTLMNAWAAS
jgi:hypothetical protein